MTFLKNFFLYPELKIFYGHTLFTFFKFSRLFSIFQKWTKINVQNQNSEKTFGKKNKEKIAKNMRP
jgi:hypothetical protein